MTLSELIKNLQFYEEKYGDIEITCNDQDFFIYLINEKQLDIQENIWHYDR